MNGFIATIAFLSLVYLFAQWFRLLIIKYRLMRGMIRITILSLPMFHIPYQHIRSCEVVKASQLWKPWRALFFRAWWLHTRMFVDGVVIKAGQRWYVITPEKPEQFLHLVEDMRRKASSAT